MDGSDIKDGIDKVNNYLKGKWDSLTKTAEQPEDFRKGQVLFLMLLGAIIYWVDVFFLGGATASFMPGKITVFLYALLTLMAVVVFRAGMQQIMEFIIVSIVAMVWPRTISMVVGGMGGLDNLSFVSNTQFISIFLTAVVLVTPIWTYYFLYVSRLSTDQVRGWGRKWAILCFSIAILITIVMGGIGTFAGPADLDLGEGVNYLKVYFWEYPKEIGVYLFTIPGTLTSYLNETMGLNEFTGKVDQNKDGPLGVYLEDLSPAETIFYEYNPVVIWASLKGKSFEGYIQVNNRCYTKKDKEIEFGEIFPQTVDLFYDDSSSLECIFEEGLEDGSYVVTFISSFEFPTWGYVTYTYVDKDLRLAYYSQKKNINTELNIPTKVEPIYTSGPASIEANLVDLPVSIYSDRDWHPSFGVTLANLWPQGEIVSIKSLDMIIPNDLSLERCIPTFISKEPSDEGYNTYSFKLQSHQNLFSTVTCPSVKINDPEAFLGDNLKVSRTFAIKASYIYTLEKSVHIKVEKIGK
ncbi:hypothetical protein ISS09_00490 [Candidatus Woesearchaeota archaeon]|nr:hypothetical protein [Candidatus Woesearchaeota archaeon]